jgi:hypothetical protein
MRGFKGEEVDGVAIDGVTLEKYVNKVQDIKRIIGKEILDMHLE